MKKQKPNRPKATRRSRYKITNWSQYNEALKQRGSLEIWIADEVEKLWYYAGETQGEVLNTGTRTVVLKWLAL